jgi:membrane protease YdiL (CAAX protease family)
MAFALTTTCAFLIARPTLIAELMAGGRDLAQRSTGRFGRELVQSSALLTIAWGAIVSPVGEELFFRGALYSFVQRIIKSATATTVVVAALFGIAHWDTPGGLGIVRLVSALGLGLACGAARQATRTVTASILLHALFNLISIASVRRWIVTETFPTKYSTPTLVTALGALGLLAAAIWHLARRRGSLERSDDADG